MVIFCPRIYNEASLYDSGSRKMNDAEKYIAALVNIPFV